MYAPKQRELNALPNSSGSDTLSVGRYSHIDIYSHLSGFFKNLDMSFILTKGSIIPP